MHKYSKHPRVAATWKQNLDASFLTSSGRVAFLDSYLVKITLLGDIA